MEERKPTYEELEALVKTLLLRIESLELHITKLEKTIFGLKSEKTKKNKSQDEKPSETSGDKPESPENQAPKKERRKHSGGGRQGFPNNIPRQTVRVAERKPSSDERERICLYW
jgi:hypothetical protein